MLEARSGGLRWLRTELFRYAPRGALPKISSSSVTRTITETIIGSANINVRRGLGSVSVDAFDETMTRIREITLSPAFDGVFDSDTGQSVGTKEFTIIDKATGSA